VEWKRLVISEFRNGFPASAPTPPSAPPLPPPAAAAAGGAANSTNSFHEIPKYDLSYFISPLRSMIGLRLVVFENWHHSLLSHPPRKYQLQESGKKIHSSQATTTAAVATIAPVASAAAINVTEPSFSPTPSPSSNAKGSSQSAKAKLKFALLTENEFKHHATERELYGHPILSPSSPFPQLPPHNPSDFIFLNNSWIHSTIVPRQDLEEETRVASPLPPPLSPPPVSLSAPTSSPPLPNGDDVKVEAPVSQSLTDPAASDDDDDLVSSHHKPKIWRHTISCVLCKGEDENSILGRLLIIPSRGQWIHSNCLKCSEGIYETSDGVLEGSEYLLKRYPSLTLSLPLDLWPCSHIDKICFLCGRKGASVRCDRKYCHYTYHLECALACQYSFKEMKQQDEINFYSSEHTASQPQSSGNGGSSDSNNKGKSCLYKIQTLCVAHRDSDSKKGFHYPFRSPLRCLRVGDGELKYAPTPRHNLKLIVTNKSPEEKMKMKSRLLRTGRLSLPLAPPLVSLWLP
jgi:hypothetical protein